MQIDYLDYLPDKFKTSALQLYLKVFSEKLVPILGTDNRVFEMLTSNIATDKCIVAICNSKVVGIMGIQTNDGGFLKLSLKTMIKIYGLFGGVFRMCSLLMFYHSTAADELYIDGVAVVDEMRSKGIGSHFFHLLEKKALQMGVRSISLEVIDSNPRAKILYECLGFVTTKIEAIWPLNLFFKFSFKSAAFMVKKIE
jgi:ribosomal protein S18 acetylase RimI-like enzyme